MLVGMHVRSEICGRSRALKIIYFKHTADVYSGADVEFFTNDVTVQLMCKKCSNFNLICTTI
jgi:hypothetical protein